MEYCGGSDFIGNDGDYMGICPERKPSANLKKQDLPVVPAGHLQRYADEYPVYDPDSSVPAGADGADLDGDHGVLYPDSAYGAGLFSLCRFRYLYGKFTGEEN